MRRRNRIQIFYSRVVLIAIVICHIGLTISLFIIIHHSRASELAFALAPLPKDELPPSPPFTEVCILQSPYLV